MQKWNLDPYEAGQNERVVGIRGSKMTFFRPSYHGDWVRNFRVFEAMRAWGKGQDWTAWKQRERDRVRERDPASENPFGSFR